jgi:hypothetical protein
MQKMQQRINNKIQSIHTGAALTQQHVPLLLPAVVCITHPLQCIEVQQGVISIDGQDQHGFMLVATSASHPNYAALGASVAGTSCCFWIRSNDAQLNPARCPILMEVSIITNSILKSQLLWPPPSLSVQPVAVGGQLHHRCCCEGAG